MQPSDDVALPDPLSRVAPKSKPTFGRVGEYPLEQRPELLAPAMRVISAWAALEAAVSGAFLAMLGTDARPAVAIFQALTSTAAQRDALRAAAAETLYRIGEAELFDALLRLHRSAGKGRNRVAHWIWGVVPEVPDGVLLCDPAALLAYRQWTAFRSKFWAEMGMDGSDPALVGEVTAGWEEPRVDPDKVLVYRLIDFTNLSAEIERAAAHFAAFAEIVSDHGRLADDPKYIRLCSEPDVRRELDRPIRGQKTRPEA